MSGGLLHDMEVLTQLDGSACCPRNARDTRAKHRRDGLHARGFAALEVHVKYSFATATSALGLEHHLVPCVYI